MLFTNLANAYPSCSCQGRYAPCVLATRTGMSTRFLISLARRQFPCNGVPMHVSLWLVAHFAKSSGRYWWRCRNDKTNVAFLFLSSIARLRMQVFNLYIETEISFTPPYFPACHLVEARSPVQSFLLPVALRGSLVLANASVPLLPVQGFASYG